jgi:2-polyprenyl-3-methyl-5-hydroxy-6-metoxy-1,4-benzoquinol methylase
MDRVRVAGEAIGSLPDVRTLLDVGCRDSRLMAFLRPQVEYAGADLYQNDRNTVDYVGDINSVCIDRTFDCVVALDILEHVDDPFSLFDKLTSLSNRYLVVSLPNCYDLKHQYLFAFRKTLGGKYEFPVSNPTDRHRWVMNYQEICRFFQAKASEHSMSFEAKNVKYGELRFRATSLVGYGCRFLLPAHLTTETVLGVFSRS